MGTQISFVAPIEPTLIQVFSRSNHFNSPERPTLFQHALVNMAAPTNRQLSTEYL